MVDMGFPPVLECRHVVDILALGGWFLTAKIIKASGELKEKKMALETIYASWQQLKEGRRELEKIKPELDKVNGAFVSLEQPIGFINLLEELAKKTGNAYEINLVRGLSEKPEDEEKNLPFEINLGGSFTNFMHFLKYLENMEYYAKVKSLQIQQIKGAAMPDSPGWKEIPEGSVYSIINLEAFTR